MYEGASTSVLMDELTRGIQNDVPWCMMFADDIVLIDETKVGVQQKLELWRDTLEARGFRLSRSKTEYMECRFSDNSDREAGMITFDGKVVHGSTFFRYLGSIIQKDGELDGDVAHRIKAGWLKWKSATGVLCDPDMPHRLKGKFYHTTIRPALLYGTECWAVKQCHVQKMNVAEMRMLRWMCGHTKKDRLRNEVIREKVRVASIEDKMMENRLRWFGHVRRRPVDAPRQVKLSEYIGKKYVILFFYPLDFAFVCPTEITAFGDRYEEFQKLNTEVLGVSINRVFSHLAWVQTDRKSGGLGDLKYPLVSDVTKSISKPYSVLIPDQVHAYKIELEAVSTKYRGLGIFTVSPVTGSRVQGEEPLAVVRFYGKFQFLEGDYGKIDRFRQFWKSSIVLLTANPNPNLVMTNDGGP
ncbi:hypothetical protein OROMI_012391 [Orobanche minor]